MFPFGQILFKRWFLTNPVYLAAHIENNGPGAQVHLLGPHLLFHTYI